MGRSAASDVRFDFTGSLDVARRLWTLAQGLGDLADDRSVAAADALASWQGRFGVEFAERITTEVGDLQRVALDLRGAAQGWAISWTNAMNEQNRRRYARAVERVEDDRGIVDGVVGFFAGHDDLPPEPRELTVPEAPSFAATGAFVRY
jgi:hypothetical protein